LVSRISNPILVNTALRNLQTSLRNLAESQEILATGLRIRRPSDDPLGAEGALGTANEILLKLREITVTEANDVGNAESRAAAAAEVDALIEQLVQTANMDFGGRRLFAGHQTETVPFVRNGDVVEYRGDSGLIFEEIGPNNVIPINIPGNIAFSTFIGQVIGDNNLNPDISAGPAFDTPLAQLNGGAGVQPGSIDITDGSGASATIDLSGETTIGGVIAAINAAAGIDVTASVNEDGSGLMITDNTVGPTLPLTITEVGATTTAADLGILGSSMGALLGDDLDPIVEGSAATAATLVSDLNFGAGIDQAVGLFELTDRDGNTATVDVSGAFTLGDIIAAINGAGTNVTASIASDGTGIELSDTTSTGRSQITITEAGGTTAADLGLLGTGFGATLHGARLDPAGVPSTPISLLAGGAGLSLGTIRITNGELTASVDLSGAVTVGNVLAAIERAGVRVDASVDSTGGRLVITSQTGDTPIIIVSEGNEDTAEALGIFAPGIFETAAEVRQALLNNDSRRLTQLIENVDEGISHIIAARTGTGQQVTQTSFARQRLMDLELSFEALRAETEEADLTEFATQLINNEIIYQAALETTIRVIQPTIFSFLS